MPVINSTLALVPTPSAGYNINNPLVGYRSIADLSNISATSEAVDHPVSHLVNPATDLLWKSDILTEQFLLVEEDTVEEVDYVAFARHNFGSGVILISIEVFNAGVWTEIFAPTQLMDDRPVIFRFAPQFFGALRVRLQPQGLAKPQAAVMHVGNLLVLQRRIYVGHTPLPYGRRTRVANGKSMSGEFLGKVVIHETLQSNFHLANITPGWYRDYLDPFVVAAKEQPFFWSWRPGTYEREVGYAWLINDPEPQNSLANGMMEIHFEMEGLAL